MISEKKNNQQLSQYIIVFKGHLDERRAQWFDGMDITQQPSGETVLSGPVTDQAALHGMLARLRDLGLPLLLVRRGDFKWEE